jgi:hypothetical protein
MTKKLYNFTVEKNSISIFKIAIYLSLSLHEGCPSNRRSLETSKENIQHLKHIISFFFPVGHFCLPGSGPPHSQGGSGSSRRKSMRIRIHNTDFMLGSRPGSSDVAALASSNEEDFQVDRFPFF